MCGVSACLTLERNSTQTKHLDPDVDGELVESVISDEHAISMSFSLDLSYRRYSAVRKEEKADAGEQF